ncbi:MAG: Rpn family recombination-promoting nuclease/putative transposase, partial [Spirochaetaceae bacterium]|nr:Rpn family recombination-promoting nuclease/putative transposase [Spirochaetaceae bacterium]
MERLNPLNDYLFLKVMGEKGAEEQCLAFLNAVFEDTKREPVKLVKILENRVISPEILGDKGAV